MSAALPALPAEVDVAHHVEQIVTFKLQISLKRVTGRTVKVQLCV